MPWSLEAIEKSVGAGPSSRDRKISNDPALTVPLAAGDISWCPGSSARSRRT